MSCSDLDEVQTFVVVDRRILCELNTIPNRSFNCYLHAIFVLLATHYTFNIAYKKSQHLYYMFLEEFFLGITPKKKTQKYRRIVHDLYKLEYWNCQS